MTTQLSVDGHTYELSDEKSRIEAAEVHHFLANESYWARGCTLDTVRSSIDNSYCIGCYTITGSLAAFARVITDWTTMYYICDLFVVSAHRRRGLGKALVRSIVDHPSLKGISGMLLTADAHGLYAQFGFVQNESTRGRFMRRPRSG